MIKMDDIKTGDEDPEVLQLYYLLRAKKAYAEELNDQGMSERMQSDISNLPYMSREKKVLAQEKLDQELVNGILKNSKP